MMDGVQHAKGNCMAPGIKLNVFLFILLKFGQGKNAYRLFPTHLYATDVLVACISRIYQLSALL